MTVEMLGIEGLEWRPNLVAYHSPNTIYLIESTGGGVTDTLYFVSDEPTPWFDLHVGQVDRLTFFGRHDKVMYGSFIDCRDGSATLHKRVDISFRPDPTRHLFIDRGIGYRIANRDNVTVRMENLWFSSEDNPSYDIFNDDLAFFGDALPSDLPKVTVNPHPVPNEALQYVLAQQQAALSRGISRTISSRVFLNGDEQRVTLTPRRAGR